MRTLITAALVAFAAVAFAPSALTADVPFPAAQTGDVFVTGDTVTASGAVASYYTPGATVVFRAYAVDGKTRKLLTGATVRYFYVAIPNQPNVKLRYTPRAAQASGRYRWTGSWTVPAEYATGVVQFKILVQSKAKRRGSFVQLPVGTSQLTISKTPPPVGTGPASAPAPAGSKLSTVLYSDAVNGARPRAAARRPIGCTQTNIFKRGEQLVMRAYGFDLVGGAVLSTENVVEAFTTVPGQAKVALDWGSHGAVGNKVWYWTNAWDIPADYPLGEIVVRTTFKLDGGRTETIDYPILIIP